MTQIAFNGQVLANILPYKQYLVETQDILTEVNEGIFKWTRTFMPDKDFVQIPVCNLRMDLSLDFIPSYKMIPAVSYNGNKWGDGKEPQGFSHNGTPYSFAWHRTAVAGCTYAQNENFGIGMFADTKGLEECGFSCSISEQDEKTILSLLLPEQEMPVTFVVKGELIPGYNHSVTISRKNPLICTAYIVCSKIETAKAGYAQLLDHAWSLNHHITKPWFDEKKLWELSVKFAQESLWSDENGLFGFSIGLRRTENGYEQCTGNKYEAGWCGQNISYAVSMLKDFLLHKNEISLEKGLNCLDTWTKGKLENGLALTHLEALLKNETERLKGRPIDSCNLGVMAENFLEAYETAAECGYDKPAYKEIALGICDFALKKQATNGQYPAAFNCLGEVTQPDGSTGGFLVPAVLYAFAVTNDKKYYESAKSAFSFYIDSLQKNGFSTAGALDTYCIDKESAIPLLSSALMFYHIDSEKKYLEYAELTAYYLSTWQWHHTIPYPEGSLLNEYNYDTFGGTSVSTQHHHIDPYALRYIPYLIRLSELTGNVIWKQRAIAAWDNASIGVSDGKMTAAGLHRPAGSQDEGFYHTRWGTPFYASQWLVAWPAAFRLEVLRKTEFFTKSPLHGDGIRV